MNSPRRVGPALIFVFALACAFRTDAAEPASDPNERRVTLELVNSEIADALRLLAKQGGLNLVIGPDVVANVTVSLSDVPVRQALTALVEGNGFKWTQHEDIITVVKPAAGATANESAPPLLTNVLRPRSVNATLLRDALVPVLSKWGKLTVLSEDSRPGYGLGTFESTQSGDAPQGTTFRSASRSDLVVNATGAAPAGLAVPSGGQDGSQRNVANSQILIVTDTPGVVKEIERLVAELDAPPRQVLIESRIVEMSVSLQKQLGIDWTPEVFANGPILAHEFPLFRRADFAPGPIDGLALGVVDFSQFTALFRATQDDNAIRLLANPRMLVYNNHSASILVGEKYPLLTSTITDQGTTTESFDTYIPVGVQLSVTPTVLADGRVSMLVHPATSALGEDVVGTTGLRVARIQTREIDTRVVMRDGDTIVLGGLISDRTTHTVRKVPGLGDIPILDIVTRQERPRKERVDLLVFITVHVEGATDMTERDREIYRRYKPQFRRADTIHDVRLHFDFPGTQFHEPKESADEPDDPGDEPPQREPAIQAAAPDAPIELPTSAERLLTTIHAIPDRDADHAAPAQDAPAPAGQLVPAATSTASIPPAASDAGTDSTAGFELDLCIHELDALGSVGADTIGDPP
ncbi:MAG: hypothetical protein L6Q92_13195 [Phycisphaerae bacterium]|nr:hypothetical protein [Phycisphaerae bacterium]